MKTEKRWQVTGRVIVCLYLTCLAGGVAHAEATLSETTKPGDFKTIEWVDLIPQDDLDALLSPPDYLDEIADGSPEDQMSNQLQATITAAADDRYQQALVSTAIKAEMNGVAVRLPGFIVPLEYNSEQLITEFFIVPFFGACIHVPPPPPNQIVYVKSSEGFKFDALYKPFWVSGVLQTNLIQNDMATAAYTMDVSTLEYYED